MQKALAGKSAIVTGGSKGLGRHFVTRLLSAGANVTALGRPSVELDSLSADASNALLVLPCDICDPAQVNAAVGSSVERFGGLDILVNNAAVYEPYLVEQASDSAVLRDVSTNIIGPIWMIRAAIPHLRKTRGQIVSISSESVRNPFPMLSIYAATKSALETLSTGLQAELRSDGIRVSILRSGSVSGGSGDDGWSDASRAAFFAKIVQTGHAQMTGQAADPRSMADALIALVSLPSDINAGLFEVTAAAEGMPEGAEKAG